MLTTIRFVLLTALRDRLFLGLLCAVIVTAFVSTTLGSTAFLEEAEMSISFAAGAIRLTLIVGLIVFVCFHIRSAFESREIDVMLSRPVSRLSLVVAYWLGFALVASLLLIPSVIVLAIVGVPDWHGFAVWVLSVWLELLLVVALALFAALALKSAVMGVIACFGFYGLSRMMAFFVMSSHSGMVAEQKLAPAKYLLWAVSTVLPRLDFFSKSEWLVYGMPQNQEAWAFVIQAIIFIPLLIFVSMADFKRRQF